MNIYYVDCENVGSKHITQVSDEPFKVIYFTSKDVRVTDLKENEEEIICSLDRRKDALDYIIDTYLGYNITKYNNKVKHHIVSNDKGFDNVINFWNNRGYQIDRSCLHTYSKEHIDFSKKNELDFLIRRLTNKNRFKLYDTYKRWNNENEDLDILEKKIKSLKLAKEYTEEELEKLVNLLKRTDSGLVFSIFGD